MFVLKFYFATLFDKSEGRIWSWIRIRTNGSGSGRPKKMRIPNTESGMKAEYKLYL
jgi:hypothetical protein